MYNPNHKRPRPSITPTVTLGGETVTSQIWLWVGAWETATRLHGNERVMPKGLRKQRPHKGGAAAGRIHSSGTLPPPPVSGVPRDPHTGSLGLSAKRGGRSAATPYQQPPSQNSVSATRSRPCVKIKLRSLQLTPYCGKAPPCHQATPPNRRKALTLPLGHSPTLWLKFRAHLQATPAHCRKAPPSPPSHCSDRRKAPRPSQIPFPHWL